MKLYEVTGLERGAFFSSKRAAIKDAKFYGGAPDFTVDEVEIGKLTKATACKLASGSGYALSRKQVWPADQQHVTEPK